MTVEHSLTDVLSDFARTLATDFPIQAILDHLVVRIAEVLPIDAAGVTLIAPGLSPRYVAASDDSALRFEQLQSKLAEGPCVVAYASGEAVSVPDLRADKLFSTFSPLAVDEGLRAVFTFPLRHECHRLGALDLYRMTPGPLDDEAMEAAQTLADVATAYLLNARARNDLRESSEKAHHTSLHDPLTGLPNRTLLVERLEHAIARARRSQNPVAILFVDLDRFKAINDTYGHQLGDELLVAVAGRLTLLLRPGDTVARLAGDEFVLLCEDLDDAARVAELAGRIRDALQETFELSGTEVHISASVGIAFSGQGCDVPEQVIQEADSAMYVAKRRGAGNRQVIDMREYSLATQRTSLTHDLRGALERNEFFCDYQPIIATNGARVVGAEALVRWAHPTQGIVAPATLIPLAEHSGLINPIGRWVLEQACRDRRRWAKRSGDEFQISVNVSTRQLMSSGFAEMVETVLRDTDTDPARVTLEVTESVFVHDVERVLRVMHDLKRIGVIIALDDFGTGYSSLSYLKQFPVDIVKIDRIFIADIDRDDESCLIVSAVVGLAHGLHMTVVAEGIETAAQYNRVAALACDECQGFFFAKPMSARAMDWFINTPLTERGNSALPVSMMPRPARKRLFKRTPA